ncbi:protein-tyrosine phosphatase [Lachnospiraceae bacterium C7]|nr:protein-tyrosine phosphatase [Lachnospiraceae bacterium C7]
MKEEFIDIHCHLLPGVDDGSKNLEMTEKMVKVAYENGIVGMVFTPHIKVPIYDVSDIIIRKKFLEIREYLKGKFPKMHIYLGGEFYYMQGVLEDTPEKIRTINDTNYVLTEFSPGVCYEDIIRAVQNLRYHGYDVILAHIERYSCLVSDIYNVMHLKELGVVIQINSRSITHPINKKVKNFIRESLANQLVDIVATDAHDLDRRKPILRDGWSFTARKCGEEYANLIFSENGLAILQGKKIKTGGMIIEQ